MNVLSVIDVLDLIMLFGPTAIINLLLAVIQYFGDDIANLTSLAEVQSFFRVRLVDIYMNNRQEIFKNFAHLMTRDRFSGIFDDLEKISSQKATTTFSDLITIPELKLNDLKNVVDKLTKLSLALVEENTDLKGQLQRERELQSKPLSEITLKTSREFG